MTGGEIGPILPRLTIFDRMKKLLLFSGRKSARLEYVVSLIFNELLGLDCRVTEEELLFKKSLLPKLNYSETRIATTEFQIKPHPLLFEQAIAEHSIKTTSWQGLPAFFQTDELTSDCPFDLLAATFFMVSRYEEYGPFEADGHGRFSASQSLAAKAGFLQQPVVNQWVRKLGELLKSRFSALEIDPPRFHFQLTYDIDYAWQVRQKGFFRTAGGLLKLVFNRSFEEAISRLKILFGLTPDPYFTFDFQSEIHHRYQIKPLYFFHVGDYRGEPDAPISFRKLAMQRLIRKIAQKHEIGLHPSYRSFNETAFFSVEKQRIQSILQKEITRSRQHFLLLKFPDYYRNLIDNGISSDYSMGFADAIGFRAGMADSFFWFDLLADQQTKLRIHPFQIMDVSLKNYLNLSPENAIDHSIKLIESIVKTGGTFTLLWHNNSLSEMAGWQGWQTVFEQLVSFAKQAELVE